MEAMEEKSELKRRKDRKTNLWEIEKKSKKIFLLKYKQWKTERATDREEVQNEREKKREWERKRDRCQKQVLGSRKGWALSHLQSLQLFLCLKSHLAWISPPGLKGGSLSLPMLVWMWASTFAFQARHFIPRLCERLSPAELLAKPYLTNPDMVTSTGWVSFICHETIVIKKHLRFSSGPFLELQSVCRPQVQTSTSTYDSTDKPMATGLEHDELNERRCWNRVETKNGYSL